jgi:ATP-dependent Clp protease ATP-binding subunit ClpB
LVDARRLTQKSQEALTEAQAASTRLGHAETDTEHLLGALLDPEGGLVPRLFEAAGANLDLLGSGALASGRGCPVEDSNPDRRALIGGAVAVGGRVIVDLEVVLKVRFEAPALEGCRLADCE